MKIINKNKKRVTARELKALSDALRRWLKNSSPHLINIFKSMTKDPKDPKNSGENK